MNRLEQRTAPLAGYQITRRHFLGLLLATVPTGAIAAACIPDRRPPITPTPANIHNEINVTVNTGPNEPLDYPLDVEGSQLVDKRLTESQHPLLEGIRFYFDPNYAGGSLAMQICLRGDSFYRIVSEEVKPRPGYLVNLPYLGNQGCIVKYPVIELARGDDENVFFGVMQSGQPCEDSYKDMRAYHLTRGVDGNITGEFVGFTILNPNDLKPRGADVAQYFIPDCSNPRR